ncbi:MAG: hypothetical protein M0O98_04895 [Acholeplasmataceae bacterium]|nr:hypothetical protein [Acholeplasmataceae bacterium]
MMKKLILMLIFIMMLFLQVNIKAESSSLTHSLDRFGNPVITQDAYLPLYQVANYSEERFNNPKDMHIDKNDYLYIADTGNKKIVIFDDKNEFVLSFGEDYLMKPTGVFVRDELIFIADYGASDDQGSGRVFIVEFNKELKSATLINEFARPKSPVLEINNFIYRPSKIAVDQNKTMYVVSEGSYNGILMINEKNRFLGFFAPNNVKGTLRDYLVQFFYGNNEKALLKKKIPPSAYNVFLNDSGYVYTITQTNVDENQRGNTLKKVNNGGINFFSKKMYSASDFTSVTSGSVGNIYAVTRSGFIYEYDNEGNLLFIFGGPSDEDRLGLFKTTSAIATNSKDQVYVLDGSGNKYHVFEPTNFTSTVHQALDLYNQGKYVESESTWEEVLRYNALFDLAHKGIGKSYFIRGDYKNALKKFKIAEADEEYSLAFWEIRNIWLQKYAGVFIIAMVFLYVVAVIIKKQKLLLKLANSNLGTNIKGNQYFQELKFMFYYLKSPLDAFYEVKANKRVKVKTGIFYGFIMIMLYVLFLLLTGQLFKPVILERAVFSEEVLKVLVPLITFVFANYLVSSLMEGEGTLKAVFINTIGALMPVVVIMPLLIIISNVLTLNEVFIYQFIFFIMIAWSATLLFFSVKDTHNFSVKQTIYHFLMTILMMIVILIVFIMIYMMMMQVVEFVGNIIKEVIIHA